MPYAFFVGGPLRLLWTRFKVVVVCRTRGLGQESPDDPRAPRHEGTFHLNPVRRRRPRRVTSGTPQNFMSSRKDRQIGASSRKSFWSKTVVRRVGPKSFVSTSFRLFLPTLLPRAPGTSFTMFLLQRVASTSGSSGGSSPSPTWSTHSVTSVSFS